jgi:hypothetical protein
MAQVQEAEAAIRAGETVSASEMSALMRERRRRQPQTSPVS